MVPISLAWQRDADGYRIETFARYGKSLVRKGGELIRCQPAENEMLYAEFAGVKTPEGLLKFVDKYGLLNASSGFTAGQAFTSEFPKVIQPTDDGYEGELVEDHLKSASLIDDVLRAENRGNALARRKAYRSLAERYNEAEAENPLGHIRLVAQADSRFRSIFEASSLMSAIWLQLAQKIGGVMWGQCGWCGSWFEKGPGTDKRKDSDFCSPSHKVAYHRNKHRGC